MVQKVVSSVEMDPDPRWEFKANQFVDCNTIDHPDPRWEFKANQFVDFKTHLLQHSRMTVGMSFDSDMESGDHRYLFG